jgi:spermidine synthase
VALVIVLIGFTAVVAQIVLLRELMVVFSGDETSLGIALACWLIWTAAGSALVGRRAPRLGDARRLVAALEVLAAAAFPLSIVAVRAARTAVGSLPGELLGPSAMLLASWAALSFFCLVSGGLFAAGSRLWSVLRNASTADATGTVYLLEAAGSGLGGVLASLILLERLNSIQIALLVALLNLLAATLVVRRARCVAGVALLVVVPLSPWLERASLARLWRGFQLVETRNSVYGNLAVIQTEDSQTVYENGLAVFSVPDPDAAEEAVHYALLEHPRPTSLLLIGGGLNGSLTQALQHASLARIDYVELDPAVLDLAERRFPREWAVSGDPRVRLHRADGRLFLKTVPTVFDVIIVNLPDPRTAQLNRFYTLEFFREAARKLAPAGVLSLTLSGSENYISDKQAAFLRSIRRTVGEVFPEVLAIPGSTIHFFASRQRGVLVGDPRALAARLAARGLKTTYVREYYLPFRMAPDRMADLEAQIRPRPETPLNMDFAPIACYLDAALWSSRFPGWDRGFPLLAAGALLALVVFLVAGPTPAAAVAAMGFTQIGLEMILLLGFQAVYGYVYQQLAVVIAGFMAGLALGSWFGLRRGAGFSLRTLVWLQILAASSGLALCALLRVSHLLYPLLALLCGLLGGYQFIVASKLWRTTSTGALYALDLAGASAGAILFGAWLIPAFGFWRSAALIAVMSLAPLLPRLRPKSPPPGPSPG